MELRIDGLQLDGTSSQFPSQPGLADRNRIGIEACISPGNDLRRQKADIQGCNDEPDRQNDDGDCDCGQNRAQALDDPQERARKSVLARRRTSVIMIGRCHVGICAAGNGQITDAVL